GGGPPPDVGADPDGGRRRRERYRVAPPRVSLVSSTSPGVGGKPRRLRADRSAPGGALRPATSGSRGANEPRRRGRGPPGHPPTRARARGAVWCRPGASAEGRISEVRVTKSYPPGGEPKRPAPPVGRTCE